METVKTQDVTVNDLNWKIDYDPDRCTMCGSCVAACTFNAIEVVVERQAKQYHKASFHNRFKLMWQNRLLSKEVRL